MKHVAPLIHHTADLIRASQNCGARARIASAHRTAAGVALSILVVACAAPGGAARPLVAERQVIVEGRVMSVDASPMAYDGDALVVLHSVSHGPLTVHLPARTNLCRAQGLGLLGELRVGDQLQVEGMATGPADISVCQEPSHRLQRID